MVTVGSKAPPFRVKDTEGNVLELQELCALGPLVLIFYPKAFTPG